MIRIQKMIDVSTLETLKESGETVLNHLLSGTLPIEDVREVRRVLLGIERGEFHKIIAEISNIESEFYDTP